MLKDYAHLVKEKERIATKGEGKEERGREKSKENINTVGDRSCSRIEV